MTRKQYKTPETSSMHSSKHPEVCRLLEDANLRFTFHQSDEDSGCTKSWDTAVMGRFVCHNPKCATNGWSSKQVAMTIRMYPRREYNARVYHQRCMGCGNLSRPILDDTYAERVTYWLKKWCGIKQEKPPHGGKSKGPHQKRFCEGCKAGHCSQLEYG
ncbi:zinc-binding domain-containing protein [Xylaria arbuscula]|nr:zinc-binding domain-containing protein [Xylaria arbuscula]